MKTPIIAAIVVVLIAVVGVGAFFAGSAYGQQQAQNIRADFQRTRQGGAGAPNGAPGAGGQNAQQFGRLAATGTIKSLSGNTLVVTQQDGSTVTVTLDSQTQIIKTVNGVTSDLQPGERITVMSDQTTGNIIARTIQLRPTTQLTQ